MTSEVQGHYGNKVRVRICGLCIVDEKMLLVNHSSITMSNFWAPPGGGLNFEEPASDCLKREFLEETGLEIEVADFLFACEFIRHPLHAVELFFKVKPITTELIKGNDPEPGSPDIIKDVGFKSWKEIQALPSNETHGIFSFTDHPSKVVSLQGYFRL
jgi:8-oxo-dGTP diphosphatase